MVWLAIDLADMGKIIIVVCTIAHEYIIVWITELQFILCIWCKLSIAFVALDATVISIIVTFLFNICWDSYNLYVEMVNLL